MMVVFIAQSSKMLHAAEPQAQPGQPNMDGQCAQRPQPLTWAFPARSRLMSEQKKKKKEREKHKSKKRPVEKKTGTAYAATF